MNKEPSKRNGVVCSEQTLYTIKNCSTIINKVGIYIKDFTPERRHPFDIPNCVMRAISAFYNADNSAEIIEASCHYGCRESIDSPCFVFFAALCETPVDVMLHVFKSDPNTRFWVDNEFIDYAHIRSTYTLNLSEGIHYFIWQYPYLKSSSNIIVRINSFKNELKWPTTGWINNNLQSVPALHLLDISRDLSVYQTPRFYLTCGDRVRIDHEQDVELNISQFPSGRHIMTTTCKIYDIVDYDLCEYQQDEYIVFTWRYRDKSGGVHEIVQPYYFWDTKKRLLQAISEAEELLTKPLPVEEYNYLLFKTNEAKARVTHPSVLAADNYIFEKSIKSIRDSSYKTSIYSPGAHEGAIQSSLDDKLFKYRLYIPEGYDGTREYPLIARYATAFGSSSVQNFEEAKWEKSFVLDIDAGGVTFGSYAGEVLFMETLQHIVSKYPIDENRIYGHGFCAGASGIFAIAEEHPDLFAAIAVYSGGVNRLKLNNLNNTPILHFETSELLPKAKYEELFAEHPNYKLTPADHFGHNILETISLNTVVLDELLSYKKNPHPDKISFTTTNSRHKKAFWLTVNSFDVKKGFGKVIVSVNDGRVNINAINTTSFSIVAPPQADGCIIVVNGKDFGAATAGEEYLFELVECDFVRVKKLTPPPIYEGTGLLDVFFSPLMVVNYLPDDENAANTATTMANPVMNTYSPKIHVSYPIVSEIPEDTQTLSSHSFVVIDNNLDVPFLNELRKQSRVGMDKHGLYGGNDTFVGKYCVMQILSNPHNPDHSILYINTNDTEMLHKNLLARKMILPTYMSGTHPLLNRNIYVFAKQENP